MNKTEISLKIIEAFNLNGKEYLTLQQFANHLQRNKDSVNRLILKFWEKWSVACSENGIKCGPSDSTLLVPNNPITQEECLIEISRVANILNTIYLSHEDFKKHSKINPITIIRKFGTWETALNLVGLQPGKNYHKEIPNNDIIINFLDVTTKLTAIPSLNQIAIHGKFSKGFYERKLGSYSKYKSIVSKQVLDSGASQDKKLNELFELEANKNRFTAQKSVIRPHYEGETLNFRHFAYNPTYENEVVSIFSSVAGELGFEIITIRSEFPDCKARRIRGKFRNRMENCLIEFEFKSSDFVKHNHPINGCDLIICWEHDWQDCPIEVINLKNEIKKLSGWK